MPQLQEPHSSLDGVGVRTDALEVPIACHGDYQLPPRTAAHRAFVKDSRQPSILFDSQVQQHVLPVVINLSTDPVPNIRFNVAKPLQSLATQVCATPPLATL